MRKGDHVKMGRFIPILIAVALVVSLGIGMSVAGGSPNDTGHPSAKATAEVGNITLIEYTEDQGWTTILSNTIKTPNQKNLFIDVSLECGLWTYTHVKSKRKSAADDSFDTSTAKAQIQVRVLVDGKQAYPGNVTFASRNQEMSAKFMGIFTGDCLIITCDDATPPNCTVSINYDCLEPEELKLLLESMTANSFNFVSEELNSGVHTVEVQAKIATDVDFDEGNAEAAATVGRGTVTVETVRMIQGEEYLIE